MKKIVWIIAGIIVAAVIGYFTFLYSVSYSNGTRAGELIKISHKGVLFKTWEGEISQGISGAQIFSFSVLDSDAEVIAALQELQGQYVTVSYVERYRTFPWWGDSHYFITQVKKGQSPFKTR